MALLELDLPVDLRYICAKMAADAEVRFTHRGRYERLRGITVPNNRFSER